MSKGDSITERERLTTLYSGMSDAELDRLVDAANDLSETAREVLKAEIEHRGGHLEYEFEPAEAQATPTNLVVVGRYRDLELGFVARGALAASGIESFLADENLVRMDWFWSNMIGNMRLLVREEDAEAAMKILAEPIPASFQTDELLFEQPKCPKCSSIDIQFEGWDRGVALTTAALLAPLPLRKNAWHCNSCGVRWQELPDPAADAS